MSRPIIPVQIPPFGCLKSSSNYAHLVQLQLRFPVNAAAPVHPNLLGIKAMADLVMRAMRS
jgi:hypothetical protein